MIGRLLCSFGLHRPVVTQHILMWGTTHSKGLSCERPNCTWGKTVRK